MEARKTDIATRFALILTLKEREKIVKLIGIGDR